MQKAVAELYNFGTGAGAAAVCVSLRCLESLVARDGVISLPGHLVGQIVHTPAIIFRASKAAQHKWAHPSMQNSFCSRAENPA